MLRDELSFERSQHLDHGQLPQCRGTKAGGRIGQGRRRGHRVECQPDEKIKNETGFNVTVLISRSRHLKRVDDDHHDMSIRGRRDIAG